MQAENRGGGWGGDGVGYTARRSVHRRNPAVHNLDWDRVGALYATISNDLQICREMNWQAIHPSSLTESETAMTAIDPGTRPKTDLTSPGKSAPDSASGTTDPRDIQAGTKGAERDSLAEDSDDLFDNMPI